MDSKYTNASESGIHIRSRLTAKWDERLKEGDLLPCDHLPAVPAKEGINIGKFEASS